MSPPPLSVCPFSEENATLRKEVESLRHFKRTIWSEAVEGMRGWAQREGLDVGHRNKQLPGREPPTCKVLPFPTDPDEFDEEPTDIWEVTPMGETPLEEAIAQSIEDSPTSIEPVDSAEMTPSGDLSKGERRKFPRVPLKQSVRFCAKGWQHTIRATVSDLSLGGMFIQSDKLPQVGEEVACGFHMIGEHGAPILAKGRVVWISQEEEGFGLKFIKISTEHLVQIADIVRERGGYPEPTIPGWPMGPLL
jgi:hypothetical protein